LEFSRLLNRQFGGSCAFEDLIHASCCTTHHVDLILSVAQEETRLNECSFNGGGRQSALQRQFTNLIAR
jgi:hypothetical protein